jgi:hypothetical protein
MKDGYISLHDFHHLVDIEWIGSTIEKETTSHVVANNI